MDYMQYYFMQMMQQQQQGIMALTLPRSAMEIFSGNPVDYCNFIRAFETLVEQKTTNPSALLYYLIQYTSGSVQELMKSCLSMRSEDGYYEARRLLKIKIRSELQDRHCLHQETDRWTSHQSR